MTVFASQDQRQQHRLRHAVCEFRGQERLDGRAELVQLIIPAKKREGIDRRLMIGVRRYPRRTHCPFVLQGVTGEGVLWTPVLGREILEALGVIGPLPAPLGLLSLPGRFDDAGWPCRPRGGRSFRLRDCHPGCFKMPCPKAISHRFIAVLLAPT